VIEKVRKNACRAADLYFQIPPCQELVAGVAQIGIFWWAAVTDREAARRIVTSSAGLLRRGLLLIAPGSGLELGDLTGRGRPIPHTACDAGGAVSPNGRWLAFARVCRLSTAQRPDPSSISTGQACGGSSSP